MSLWEISFPASDLSFPLCAISFQLCDISFPLRDISFLLFDVSFLLKDIVSVYRHGIVKYMYTSLKIMYDNDESSSLRSQLFEMASGELKHLIKNTTELTCLDSMKKIHSIMREILLQIS